MVENVPPRQTWEALKANPEATVEVTPAAIRLRKRFLKAHERKRAAK